MTREGYHQAPNRLRTWSYEDRGLAKPRRIDRQEWRTAEERARIMETAKDVMAKAMANRWAWFKGEAHE